MTSHSSSEWTGVAAAILSSSLGGTAIVATRTLVGAIDPATLGVIRFGIGMVVLIPAGLLLRQRFPARRDWPGVAVLGLLFFALFPMLFNAALIYTTAARGALALTTLPLLTMVVAALLGVERLTLRKSFGVALAMIGVAIALLSGLSQVPAGAWRGDLLMAGAALCMAIYSVLSRSVIARSGALSFTALAMVAGVLGLLPVALWGGGLAKIGGFGTTQVIASGYLGIFGAALTFLLWAFALSRTTPTRVATSMAVNPIVASVLGALLLGEPIGWSVPLGLVSVLAGIWITSFQPVRELSPTPT